MPVAQKRDAIAIGKAICSAMREHSQLTLLPVTQLPKILDKRDIDKIKAVQSVARTAMVSVWNEVLTDTLKNKFKGGLNEFFIESGWHDY